MQKRLLYLSVILFHRSTDLPWDAVCGNDNRSDIVDVFLSCLAF